MRLGRQSIGARHPHPDWIYLIGPTALEHTPGRLWNVPYYGRSLSIKIVKVADLSPRLHDRVLVWDARRDNWHQLPPRPTEAGKNKTMSLKLSSTYTANNRTRKIGFVLLMVETALTILTTNTKNREVKWYQVAKLLATFRAGKDETGWVPEASTFCIDWLNILADGQHRLIAFVLAFGTKEQIRRLMMMVGSWPQSGYKLPPSSKLADIETIDLVPVKGFEFATQRQIDNMPELYVPVIVDCDPKVADVSGVDEAHRTGADQLVRNSDTGNMIAQWGLTGKDLQEILRYVYLRVLPSSKEGESYGSVRRGGNIHPDRYPVMARNFQSWIEQAMTVVHDEQTGLGWSADACPISHTQVIATIALALQGGISKDVCRKVYADFVAVGDTKPSSMVKAIRDAKNEKALPVQAYAYALSYSLNAGKTPNVTSVKQLVTLLGGVKDYEQQPANRLPGWDSTGCADIVSASLAKKLKARDKAKTTKAR